MLISEAMAQQAGAAGGGDLLTSFLPLIAIFAIFYFLLIRPQQKKQKEHQAKIAAVRRGDKIITGGGFYGTVTKVISDTEVQVELAENVKVKVATQTIMDVLSKTEPANDAAKPAEEKKSGLGALFGAKKKEDK
ncbi:preprotein translocase subunit YajC [Aestuariispira insulae]|uniref:Sec translocon accessory complex subunit YajC n=1 Tax=Aestuariispira insulae TaxID=1461337 RepID=A0A3D9HNH5_9PROT|nr:preprotein translocase subunit YajC [Aestuariispira insulae]RED51044.1 protein translocase subunit yajC [Aestuariispira insulae]